MADSEHPACFMAPTGMHMKGSQFLTRLRMCSGISRKVQYTAKKDLPKSGLSAFPGVHPSMYSRM